MRPWIHAIVLGGAALIRLGSAPAAQLVGDFALDPKTYTSPSGEYTLFVDPSRPEGGGEASYSFNKGGAELC